MEGKGKVFNHSKTGHEVPLAYMISRRKNIFIELMNGKCILGAMSAFDKFSITVTDYVVMKDDLIVFKDAGPRVIFKHAIESFSESRQ